MHSICQKLEHEVGLLGVILWGEYPKKGGISLSMEKNIILCGIMKFVVASAAEAELGALFMNSKDAKIII